MANFFNLELDTTPPTLNIGLDSIIVKDSFEDIVISANEFFRIEEFYSIDAQGNRVDYDTDYFGDNLIYTVKFDFPYGFVTFYVKAIDEVRNVSSLYNAVANVARNEIGSVSIENNMNKTDIDSIINDSFSLYVKNNTHSILRFNKTKLENKPNKTSVSMEVD